MPRATRGCSKCRSRSAARAGSRTPTVPSRRSWRCACSWARRASWRPAVSTPTRCPRRTRPGFPWTAAAARSSSRPSRGKAPTRRHGNSDRAPHTMNEKAGIYWQQGMFLQPQHFQQSDLHQQFQRKPTLENGQPHFWGVGELSLSTGAIANLRIEVQSARVLFPDRSYVEYPGNAVMAARAFTADMVEGDKPVTVYLGLRRLHASDANVTTVGELGDAALASTRFATTHAAEEVPDL